MKNTIAFAFLLIIGWTGFIAPTDFPSAKITNGEIEAELDLPDANRG